MDGKGNKVSFYTDPDRLVREAVSSLAVKVCEYKRKYGKKCLVVTGCAASNGTTRAAINLAISLSRMEHKTLLVDADMRSRSKHDNRMLDKGLCDVLCGMYIKDEVIKPTNIGNLHFMPSGRSALDSAMLLCSNKADQLLKILSTDYDFVILDCPAVTVVPETAALFMDVDGILLICSLNKTTKKQLDIAKSLIEPYSEKYYGIIVNSVDEGEYKRFYPDHGYYAAKYKNMRKCK